jgi:hypothetical protein
MDQDLIGYHDRGETGYIDYWKALFGQVKYEGQTKKNDR